MSRLVLSKFLLKEKNQISKNALENKGAAYDKVVLKDTILDDAIRDISDAAKQYDRKNVGRGIYTDLFPDGKTTTIIGAPLTKEPDKADRLLQRFDRFEEGNPLLTHKMPLSTAITEAKTAISAYEQAIGNEQKVLADEAMAKEDLVRQYELNYHGAALQFGKKYANRLFPKTAKTKKEEPIEEMIVE